MSLLLMTAAAGAEVLYRAEDQVVPAEYLGTDGEGILVRFALPALTAETVTVGQFGEGTLMRIPGEGMGMPMGSPDLPVIRRMVLIPNTGDVTIEMVSTEATPLGIFDIPPFQEYPTRSGGAAPYRIDRDIYSTSELYPSQPVILDRISILRDIRVAWVYFSPVQYNPVTGETVLNTEVTVRLAVSGTGENEIPRPFQGHTRSFIPIYEQVLGFEVAGSNVIDGSYLVIGIQDAIDCVQDLIDWKKQTGTEVFYGVIPSIGSTAAEIDDYIEDAYNTWPNPPEWVLLVGDEDVMPVYYSSGTAADNQYGVIGTGYDPSIHVGRICGDTADLTYQAWKIESHESDPYEPSPSWFQHAISIGSTDFQDPWMSYRYSEIFQANGMPTTLYCSNTTYGGIPPTVALISDEINDGTSLVSYIGHGSTQSWGTTGFDNGDVAALSNGRRLSWISSIACYNGEFQGSTTCFGEAWMNEGTEASPKGAIGFMGATTSSPVGPTDSLALYQFRGYFEAFDYGKIMAYYYTGNSSNSDMHMIFGCPEMDIYCTTGPLVHLSGSHPSTIAPGSWSVTVTAGGSPVEGALVGIVQDTTFLESGYTNGSGVANLTIPTIPGTELVTVTATAHNCYPYVANVSVSGTGVAEGGVLLPSLILAAPVPNPFSATTTVSYALPVAGEMSLDVYDLSGRRVTTIVSGSQAAGAHSIEWAGTDGNGTPVPGGVYLMRLTADGNSFTRSCVVVR
ncbi:MAG: hypothetical protein AVO35_05150 [Candidatus Aegiribacteria sp. MLS_C]|nr:MAG: hypothetical protein AVO35_05150 [Candidatus Aegiribacteria sp. MLS_C]